MLHNWSKVKEKHIEEACRLYDSGEEKLSRPARSTFLIVRNKHYPAKFIRGLAYKLATGKSLNPNCDYEGGEKTATFFTDRGYTVKYNGQQFNPSNEHGFNPSSDAFWKLYELDLQEVKIQYLRWALNSAQEVNPKYTNKFIYYEDEYTKFCIVNSRYGHAFAQSPFGSGVRGIPESEIKGDFELPQEMKDLLKRLKERNRQIRKAIQDARDRGHIEEARNYVLDFYWIKLGPHELLFDRIRGEKMDPENHSTCHGIRNRILNVIRRGEELEDKYVKKMDKMLPPYEEKDSKSIFLRHYMTWNRYAMCAFDCGPVLWSRSKTFVHFKDVRKSMNRKGWPEKGEPEKILNGFYQIALDYRKKPICLKDDPNNGYTLKSMRTRKKELHSKLKKIIDQINQERRKLNKM